MTNKTTKTPSAPKVSLNKTDLIKIVKEEGNTTLSDAANIVDIFLKSLTSIITQGNVELKLTGHFNIKSTIVPPRKGINPKDRTEIDIPSRVKISFKASDALKKKVPIHQE